MNFAKLVERDARHAGGKRLQFRAGAARFLLGLHPVAVQAHDLRPHDPAAESLADRLMAQADTHDWSLAGGGGHQVEADAGLIRIAGTGRQHDALGLQVESVLDCERVVAPDLDFCPKLSQEMEEVVGKAVVVVDQQKHINYLPGFSEHFNEARSRSYIS